LFSIPGLSHRRRFSSHIILCINNFKSNSKNPPVKNKNG
jgi:hypothetical protein